jgi:cytochrome c2
MRAAFFASLGLAALVLFSRTESKPQWARSALSAGKKILERYQCASCHAIEGVKGANENIACAGCHIKIMSTRRDARAYAEAKARDPSWDRYLQNIRGLYKVPSLTHVGRRVRASWLEAFLEHPWDIRPHLVESMIPAPLEKSEIRTLVRYFAARAGEPDPYAAAPPEPPPPPRPADAELARGERLFLRAGCPSCHLFGNRDLKSGVDAAFYRSMYEVAAAAPDLRHARERMRFDRLALYIENPRRVDPLSTMPVIGVRPDDARAMATFLWYADPGKPVVRKVPPLPPALRRTVGFAEVQSEVLNKICIHCHMNESEGNGEGGPGNTGGLGFKGRGLDLTSFEGVMRGSLDDSGKRRSLFDLEPDGHPLLLSRVLKRYEENLRDFVPYFEDDLRPRARTPRDPKPGMPLGYPALTLEQLAILRTWIEQGHPGP